jgi:hypothetical protein
MGHGDEAPGHTFDLEFFLDLKNKVNDIHKRIDDANHDIVYQSPFFGQLAGNGTLDQPEQNAVPLGLCWGVRRFVATGFTAGTVTAISSQGIEPVMQAGVTNGFQYFAKGAVVLQPGDRLQFVAAGITGGPVLIFGMADTFPYWYLRRYLD